jgi:DNA-binding MarR family transcriptional regulator
MNNPVTTTLRCLTGDVERLLADRLQPVGLTVPQMQFLADFAANPGHCGADASTACHVSPQTGTTIMQNLVAKRYITAKRLAGHGRRHQVTVTARGKEALARAVEAVADVEKQVTEILGPDVTNRLATAVTDLQPHLPARGWRPQRSRPAVVSRRAKNDPDKADQLDRRCRQWADTFGKPGFVPDYIANQYGTQPHIDHLVASGRWAPEETGYRIND